MSIPIDASFAGTAIVLVANQLNLSIFKPVWLCKNGILKEEEIPSTAFISQAAIQIPSEKFNLSILPNRLQLAFSTDEEEPNQAIINRILGGILHMLPHSPITAMGVNFEFLLRPADPKDFADWNLSMFTTKINKSAGLAEAEDPKFGAYVSMNVHGMRLKLDMKPCHFSEAPPETFEDHPNFMRFAFNYHVDLNEDGPTHHALENLMLWSKCLRHAQALITKLHTPA